jgi:hypothetical protein
MQTSTNSQSSTNFMLVIDLAKLNDWLVLQKRNKLDGNEILYKFLRSQYTNSLYSENGKKLRI